VQRILKSLRWPRPASNTSFVAPGEQLPEGPEQRRRRTSGRAVQKFGPRTFGQQRLWLVAGVRDRSYRFEQISVGNDHHMRATQRRFEVYDRESSKGYKMN